MNYPYTSTLVYTQLDLNLRKKPVKYDTWSVALLGVETCTHRKVERKYLESFDTWCWRRMEKIIWTDRVRNEEILQTVSLSLTHTIAGAGAHTHKTVFTCDQVRILFTNQRRIYSQCLTDVC